MDRKRTTPSNADDPADPADGKQPDRRSGPIEIQIHMHDASGTVVRIRETGSVTISSRQVQNAHGIPIAVWKLVSNLSSGFFDWLRRGKQGPFNHITQEQEAPPEN